LSLEKTLERRGAVAKFGDRTTALDAFITTPHNNPVAQT